MDSVQPFIAPFLALANRYNDSQTQPKPLALTKSFISLLANGVKLVTPLSHSKRSSFS